MFTSFYFDLLFLNLNRNFFLLFVTRALSIEKSNFYALPFVIIDEFFI